MKKYLAIIRRADFIDLYKYGFFYLDKKKIIEFDCEIPELPNRSDIFDSLFDRMNSFESSFAYLIINYTKREEAKDSSLVFIEELRHIFPLDLEAKREFESSFDEHIKIDNPIWDDAVSLMKKKQLFHSSMQGAKNIFNIFKLKGFDKCKEIINDDVVKEMLSAVYDDVRPQGELPIWVYLMRYERHSFYPKDSLGYFMDIVHIIVNFMAKQEVDDYTVENTEIYNILCKFEGKGLKSKEIMNYLKSDEGAAGFLNKISSFVPEIDFITTAVSYLKLRDVYKDEFVYNENFVENCKSTFGKCFTLAAYMAGIAFSHDKTYSCLYEVLPLAVYKSKEEMAAILKRKQEEKERAQREMERIECERERERELEQKRRKACKKGQEYNPSGMSGYSQGNYQGHILSTMGRGDKNEAQKQELKTNKEVSHVDTSNETSNLFGKKEFQEMEIQTGNSISYPLTLQKYTKKGSRSRAKNSIAIVKNKEEHQDFLNSHSGETWKPQKQ